MSDPETTPELEELNRRRRQRIELARKGVRPPAINSAEFTDMAKAQLGEPDGTNGDAS